MEQLLIKDDWKDILVYLQYRNNKIHPVSYQLMGKAHELASSRKWNIYGIVIGRNTGLAREQLEGYPLKKVYLYETNDYFMADLYEKLLINCINLIKPSVVLIGGTAEGKAVAPRVSTAFKTGLTADCTELHLRENSDLVQVRPAFGGNIMAQIVTGTTRPQFATVRYNVFQPLSPVFHNETEFAEIVTHISRPACLEIQEVTQIPYIKGIADQKILVVAGRGVKKKEDLTMLKELAELLGGELASTRGLVEKGWMESDRQIGLSGQTVSPKLMITCGVSGSVQFIAGMRGTQNIVAINTDPNAGIFEIAHYPVCGDIYEIVPGLIALLKNNQTGIKE